ncbi:hypothetical protein DYU05_07560 [Mucilaginibacter terrenus]|uniref:Uncharacterized protein n=1 Tax=Mucilaginibacter terrenus TaxID=2482727 RepID=A0A3E2NWQ4_9SPHI|nr:hypothetical protein [Mucilaginibacter terrenus]RFZ85444.1 hypothetical protein DYU05_07560 [Mucilaginibacter terrenus]
MKTKEEILNSYEVKHADGVPEISAEDLLKAMEEYRLQAEQAAFEAARQSAGSVAGITYKFANFDDYQASLQPPPIVNNQAANIQLIADSILEQFIPQDKSVYNLSFNIRTEGHSYSVNYVKNPQGYWYFDSFSDAE